LTIDVSQIVEPDKAEAIASNFMPIIYQEWGCEMDCITPIALGKPEEVVADMPFLIQKPYLYYGVRQNALYQYVFFLVYHPFDYSTNPIRVIRMLDEHRHDTECMLFRKHRGKSFIDVITVAHERFCYQKNTDRRVVIKKGGHAIYPYAQKIPGGNYMKYQVYDLFVNLNEIPSGDWEIMRKGFDGVKMPDEQFDSTMMRSASGKLKNRKGDIFNRPEVLFASAELKGWM
jgi:hypothetical protein